MFFMVIKNCHFYLFLARDIRNKIVGIIRTKILCSKLNEIFWNIHMYSQNIKPSKDWDSFGNRAWSVLIKRSRSIEEIG